ncbi:hypothetical protein [Paenibacillus turpanensis]|uniref:hypothetical protein n=1 Tax=Paenibacillus turpanensis TaxID=2689078 RepID=UPI001407B0FB|nr:hypothetical protein [Paenibacillus turpanensis]
MDQEISVHTLFWAKRGMNRAVHAGALQLDREKLALGIRSIDEERALQAFRETLERNLRLEPDGTPRTGSFLRDDVELVDFYVAEESEGFPHTYRNESFDYTVTFSRPGVAAIVKIKYPALFTVLDPIVWYVKASAELVYE